jgi:hypothetical protein
MKWIICISLLIFSCLATSSYAQIDENPLGQVITIDTRFRSYVGNPIWSIVIRDIDHNQNIPYLFDLRRGANHWVIFTYGRNYLISASNMQIETYQMRYNKYRNYRMTNFCNLESNGHILKGESMSIVIEGDLSPYSNSYSCNISVYPDDNFFVYRAN